jgi:hypothetical protein
MVSIRNFEKYFTDHPDTPGKEKILNEARKCAERGIVMGGRAEKILGPLAQQFFQEVENNEEHIKIGLEDMQKARKSLMHSK